MSNFGEQLKKIISGIDSAFVGVTDNPSYFQIDAPVQPGSSGGATCDKQANVVDGRR